MAYLTKRASLWYANAIATALDLEAAELLPTDTLYTSALLKSSMFPLRQALSLSRRPLVSTPRLSHSVLNPRSLSLCQKSRPFSSSPRRPKDASSATAPRQGREASAAEASTASSTAQTHLTFKPPEPRLSLTFTCTAEGCHTRSTHQFTRRSYEKGIVLVECPGCKNRHLIADHLGWFKESTQDGKLKTVEDLLRAKGEKVRRGTIDADGVVEYAPE